MTKNEFIQGIQWATREYRAASDFYGDRCAKRSGVPLLRHIDEGIGIIFTVHELSPGKYRLAQVADAARAFCLHPLFQPDEDLVTAGDAFARDLSANARIVMMAMEYRARANEWLSDKVVLKDGLPCAIGTPSPGPLPEVALMLIADKVQNYKDFLEFHSKTHDRRVELNAYFKHWLEALGVSQGDLNAGRYLAASAAGS